MPSKTRYRNACWTWFTEIPSAEVIATFKDMVGYLVFQQEKCPDTERLHYQGYAEFVKQNTLASLKKIDASIHWEPRRGTAKEASDYCKKVDTRVAGPWEHGEMKTPGVRTDIIAFREAIKKGSTTTELIETHPMEMARFTRFYSIVKTSVRPESWGKIAVHLHLGLPGTGKTSSSRILGSKSYWECPLKGSKQLWFDGYDGQYNVLMDEFSGQLPLTELLRLLQPGPLQVPTKGGHTWWNPKRIFMTTNVHPRDWYDYTTRPEHYLALCRRIHHVTEFDGVSAPTTQDGLDYFKIRDKIENINLEFLSWITPIELDYEDDMQ